MEDILVIDDDKNILRIMDEFLTRLGYNVKTADNGIEGIRLLDEKRCFRLVITDIRMPGVDGNQVAKYLKGNEEMKDIPIFAISGYPDDAEMEFFDSIVKKPFSLKDLKAVVDSFS